MSWSLGALLFPVMFHVAALMVNAAFGGGESCTALSSFWCGSPFEAFAEVFSERRSYNFFTLGLAVMGGLLQTMLGLLSADYDILKSQEYQLWATLGDGIRLVYIMTLAGVVIVGAISMFRR